MLTWLASQPRSNYTETLEALFDEYIPDVLEFLAPVLANDTLAKSESSKSAVSLSERVSHSQMEPQDLMLSEVHVIKTCCQILEVSQGYIALSPGPFPVFQC